MRPLLVTQFLFVICCFSFIQSSNSSNFQKDSKDFPSGSWSKYPNALPTFQLAQVPLLGNGRLGIALDAHNDGNAAYKGIGPGQTNTIDLWINSNYLWSCTSCGNTDPDHTVPACCSTVAFGGLSIRVNSSTITFPTFSATETIFNGILTASLITSNGGALTATVRIHPALKVIVTNVSWSPASGDPAILDLDIALWVLGKGSFSGSIKTGVPAPWNTGCADAATLQTVSCGGSTSQIVFASRNASTVDAVVMPVSAALAAGLMLGPRSTFVYTEVRNNDPVYPPTQPFETIMRVFLSEGSWVSVVVAEAETRGLSLVDPAPQAISLAAATITAPLSTIADDSDAWWLNFWGKSSISLPAWPSIQSFWFSSQYILACTSATEANDEVVAPGLYGVFVTNDGPNWQGDYTLDYNYAAPYYGSFSSNRPEQTEVYWAPIVSWLSPAKIKAQVQAGYAHVTCPPNSVYYNCHIAPWGLASTDGMTKYMTWNGPQATLLFANHWEYTRNVSFAKDVIYPLFDSMNAWWLCYLNHSTELWEDVNAFNPDYEHEGQPVPNPQIAMSFIARTVSVQLDIAQKLSLPIPPLLEDLYQHLAPFNVIRINVTRPVPNATGSFEVLNNTRCSDDIATFHNTPDVAACEAHCLSVANCGLFSYCPPVSVNNQTGCTGENGTPDPFTCWSYPISRLSACVSNPASLGWTSGWLNQSTITTEANVYTAFKDAQVGDSDWFASYPSWPTEAYEPNSPFRSAWTANGITQEAAQVSSVIYTDFVNGRPVDLFEMAVRAGRNDTAAELGLAWTPDQVLNGMAAWLSAYDGPSLLPRAPGGGIETTGVSRAINDMLLQSYKVPQDQQAVFGDYVLELFPFFVSNASSPASFTSLLARGGFIVSAINDGTILSPVNITAAYTLFDSETSICTIISPWATGAVVSCGNGPANPAVMNTLPDGRSSISFNAPKGILCYVEEK